MVAGGEKVKSAFYSNSPISAAVVNATGLLLSQLGELYGCAFIETVGSGNGGGSA